jgi:LysR family transcriptional regulator, glycine cleavage system transcriptional activator
VIHKVFPIVSQSFALDGVACKRNDFTMVVEKGISMRAETRLPSMGSLRVFASVAQLGSTTRAAAKVNLTQSAVSKQVQLLEEHLGCALFERTPQGLVLSEAGELYRPYAEAALEQLARGKRRLEERTAGAAPVRLHMPAIVGERWLMQRFPDFAEGHADIDVQFTNYVSENESEEPDIQVLHGTGVWHGRTSHYLFGRDIVLVVAPKVLDRLGGSIAVSDVQGLTLLQHFQVPAYWAEFTEAHDMRGAVPARTIRYGYLSVIIRAAVAGLGIALVPHCFVSEELDAGVLINPGSLRFRSASGYHALTREPSEWSAPQRTFMGWFLDEAGRFRTPAD